MKINSTLSMTIITLMVNYLAGNNIKAVSDKHPLSFTPAGYTFSIWGVIYSLLLYVTYTYDVSFSTEFKQLYLYSNILNSVWIILWSSAGNVEDDTKYIISGCITLLSLAFVLIQILFKLDSLPQIIMIGFGIYAAWVCVAASINVSIVLKEQLGVSDTVCRNTIYVLLTIVPFIIRKYIQNALLTQEGEGLTQGALLTGIYATWSWALFGILNNKKGGEDIVIYIPLLSNIVNLIITLI